MKTYQKKDKNSTVTQQKKSNQSIFMEDMRPEMVMQTKLHDMVNNSDQVMQMQALQKKVDNRVDSSFGVVQLESRKDKIARIKRAQQGTDLGKSDSTLIAKEDGQIYSEKVSKKLQAHDKRVSEQTSEYDSNPALKGTLYVAPHEFDIAGHDTQKISNKDYSAYAKSKGLSEKDSEHYMSGLTLMEDDYAIRMEVERAEESVPGHNAHSGGYFSSKYSDDERQAFDPKTGTGSVGSSEQMFHPGKHNPYQSDFNLKHRLTDAVPADSPTGAYTNISSKFISDKISMEALNEAKKRASQELKTNPSTYSLSPGTFYKGFSVTLDLGKDVGVGFEANKSDASLISVEDLYGNSPAYKEALSQLGDATEARHVADEVKRLFALGKSRIDVKTHLDTLGYTYTNSNNIVKAGETKVYDDAVISSIPSGAATGTQTGITLKSIKADGSGAVWELGAGQHYPAQTSLGDFLMKKYGSETIVGA